MTPEREPFAEPIRTHRLILRPLCDEDASAMFAYRSDPEVARFQGWEPNSLDDVRAFVSGCSYETPWEPGAWRQAAVVLRESGELIGDIGMRALDEFRQAEVGMTLTTRFQRRGFAVEALSAAFDLLFGSYGVHRVFGSIDPRNVPSIKLVEALGMRKEAHMIRSLWFKGAWADDVIYAMLEDEWKQNARPTS